jgi:hypothetical protein
MTEQEKREEFSKVTRRNFLKNAGIVAGGAVIGSSMLLSACGKEEVPKTVQVPPTVTTPVPGGAGSVEEAVLNPTGSISIKGIHAERLGDLNGKKVAGLAVDPTKWQTHRTFPYIFICFRKSSRRWK